MLRRANRYRDVDPRSLPNYGVVEAATILGIPAPTLRTWLVGYRRRTGDDWVSAPPVLDVSDTNPVRLSFTNLVEAHVLSSLRREYGFSLPAIRSIADAIKRELPGIEHPLANADLRVGKRKAFVRSLRTAGAFEQYVDVNPYHGQFGIPEVIKAYLDRIEHDELGARRLWVQPPKVRIPAPRLIVVDPYVSFGRPTLRETGIPIDILIERLSAGEPVEKVAKSCRRPEEEIATLDAWRREQAA